MPQSDENFVLADDDEESQSSSRDTSIDLVLAAIRQLTDEEIEAMNRSETLGLLNLWHQRRASLAIAGASSLDLMALHTLLKEQRDQCWPQCVQVVQGGSAETLS